MEEEIAPTVTSNYGNGGVDNNIKKSKQARTLLYISYFCYEFSELVWIFSSAVWLAALSNYSSLFLVSAYQVTAKLFTLGLVPGLSRYIDALDRSRFVSYLIPAQHACVILTISIMSWSLRWTDNNSNHHSLLRVCSLVLICICGGVAQTLDKVFCVTIERDWIVVMAKQDNLWLERTTVSLKRIYLSCQILGPAITGYILKSGGDVIWIFSWKLVSLVIVYIFMNKVYQLSPHLQERVQHKNTSDSLDIFENEEKVKMSPSCSTNTLPFYFVKELQTYFSQTVASAGFGLALLYANTLTFGGMMTAYLVSRDVSLSAIGLWEGITSLLGLLGTFSFSISQRYMKLEETALWSIVWIFICLSISLSSVLVSDNPPALSGALIIIGVMPSRIGIWVYDISITQLFQQTVSPPIRGQMGGAQASLNTVCEFLPFLVGMIYSDIEDFWILMILGYICVAMAMILYFLGTFLPYKRISYSMISSDQEVVNKLECHYTPKENEATNVELV